MAHAQLSRSERLDPAIEYLLGGVIDLGYVILGEKSVAKVFCVHAELSRRARVDPAIELSPYKQTRAHLAHRGRRSRRLCRRPLLRAYCGSQW